MSTRPHSPAARAPRPAVLSSYTNTPQQTPAFPKFNTPNTSTPEVQKYHETLTPHQPPQPKPAPPQPNPAPPQPKPAPPQPKPAPTRKPITAKNIKAPAAKPRTTGNLTNAKAALTKKLPASITPAFATAVVALIAGVILTGFSWGWIYAAAVGLVAAGFVAAYFAAYQKLTPETTPRLENPVVRSTV